MDFEKEDVVVNLKTIKAACFDELLNLVKDNDYDDNNIITELCAMGKVVSLLEAYKVRAERS